jgi:hypothetical protein
MMMDSTQPVFVIRNLMHRSDNKKQRRRDSNSMANNTGQKLTAYVAELNAANSAIRNLKQIEVHLQTQLQSQEKELVELRLNNFQLQNDRNMNEHLKARIAGQADEFEELRIRVRKAEQLVLQKDSQLEGAKNVVRTLRDKWNVLQQQQAEMQQAVLEMAEQKAQEQAERKRREEEDEQGELTNNGVDNDKKNKGNESNKKTHVNQKQFIDIEASSPKLLSTSYNLSPRAIMRLKDYSSSLRERCNSQENVIEKQADEISELKGTIREFKERCRRQRSAIKTLKLRLGGSKLSSPSSSSLLLDHPKNVHLNKYNNRNVRKNTKDNNSEKMPPWNFRAGNYSKRQTNQRHKNGKFKNSIASSDSKEILIENLRERIEREAAAALMNSQRQLKNEYERKLMEARTLAEQREAKVENELDKLKTTIIRLLTVFGNPDKIDMSKNLNGEHKVSDKEADESKTEIAIEGNENKPSPNSMTTNKEKDDDETIKNKNGSKIPTIDSNKTISNNNNKHIKKANTKVKSALWSSSDSGDANNDNIYGGDYAYTSDDSSIDF